VQRQDHEEKGTVYYFITASTLGSIFDDSEPPNQSEIEPFASHTSKLLVPQAQEQQRQIESLTKANDDQSSSINHEHSASGSLIQAELAKRLDVHSSTVYKRRADPDFAEWSRSRDPEQIAWNTYQIPSSLRHWKLNRSRGFIKLKVSTLTSRQHH
jgi:hypothetical protein